MSHIQILIGFLSVIQEVGSFQSINEKETLLNLIERVEFYRQGKKKAGTSNKY
jgi:hypothetical protein